MKTRKGNMGGFVFIISIMLIYITFFTITENLAMNINSITGLVVENQPPEISNIPDLIIDEDSSTSINLNNYVEDDITPDEGISWSYSQIENLTISIYQNKTARISAKTNWNGQEDVTFTAMDSDGLSSSDEATITAMPVNDPPEITHFRPNSLAPILEEAFETNFEVEAQDIDGDDLTFKWYLNNELKSSGSAWNYTPSANETGFHTIKVIVSDEEFNSTHSWNINVVELNTPPVLTGDIPDQEWDMNTNLTEVFDLDDYFDDPENQSLSYSFEGNENIIIKINMSNNKPGFYPNQGWSGTETIRFIADDGNLIKKSNNVTLTVKQTAQEICLELWNCTSWQPGECPANKIQTRTCNDLNDCRTTAKKPSEKKTCILPKEETEKTMPEQEKGAPPTITKEKLSPIDILKKSKTLSVIISIFIVTGLLSFAGFEKSKSKKNLEKEKKSKNIENVSLVRLTDYIRRELQQGFGEDKIKNKLLYEGWNAYLIKKAFSNLEGLRKSMSEGEKASGIEAKLNDTKIKPSKEIRKDIKKKMGAFES